MNDSSDVRFLDRNILRIIYRPSVEKIPEITCNPEKLARKTYESVTYRGFFFLVSGLNSDPND